MQSLARCRELIPAVKGSCEKHKQGLTILREGCCQSGLSVCRERGNCCGVEALERAWAGTQGGLCLGDLLPKQREKDKKEKDKKRKRNTEGHQNQPLGISFSALPSPPLECWCSSWECHC